MPTDDKQAPKKPVPPSTDNALPQMPPGTVLRRRVFDATSVASSERAEGKARGKGARTRPNGNRPRKRKPQRGRAEGAPTRPRREPTATDVEGAAFGRTWWGKRWIEAIENVSTAYANRLPRGMSYARAGNVTDLKINPGKVEALVSGRRATPYKVSIQLRTLTTAQWKKVIEMLGNRASFTASLLAGEMPESLTEVFEQCGLSLFPRRIRELKTTCSCPDWANPCKHIAATHYVLGEALDEDPFLLLALRGKRREDILTALRTARSGEEVEEQVVAQGKAQLGVSVGQLDVATFFKAQDDLSDYRFHIALPDVPISVLRRLGDPGAWKAKKPLLGYLANLYTKTAELAEQLGLRDVEDVLDDASAGAGRSSLPLDDDFDDGDELDELITRVPGPPGTEAVLMQPVVDPVAPSEAPTAEPQVIPEGPRVLVRRAGRGKPTTETPPKVVEEPPAPPKRAEPRAAEPKRTRKRAAPPEDEQPAPAPRLSRRVVPGTTEAGTAPTLEDRLEMLLPITENMPDGPQIARQIIWALKTHGPATARQLARRTRMKKIAVLQLMQSLLTVGLVIQDGQGERARFSVPVA